jgi:hypothetical protein
MLVMAAAEEGGDFSFHRLPDERPKALPQDGK